MKNIMLTAVEARAKAQNDLGMFTEIRNIEEAILIASAAGNYEVVLSNTVMTISVVYCNVWKGAVADRAKEIQMASVVKYFTDLGYSVQRRVNPATGTTFNWVVNW